MRNLKKKKKVFHAASLLPIVGLVRDSTGRPRKKRVSALEGEDSAPGGWVWPGRQKPGVGPPGSPKRLLGALSPPRRAAPPSTHGVGRTSALAGGTAPSRPATPAPRPPPPSPEPLKHQEGQGRLGPRWRGGEGPLPAPCLLTRVRFLPFSGRDGGEKPAVTRARAVPCTSNSPQRSLPPSPAAAGLAVQ